MASQTSSPYQLPPDNIADIIDAPPTPATSLSPDLQWLALLALPSLPPIEELARHELRLAGLRFYPRTRQRSRMGHFNGATLRHLETRQEMTLKGLPEGSRLRRMRWSPDSRHIAITRLTPEGGELWLADVDTFTARRLTGPILHNITIGSYRWLPNSKELLLAVVPDELGDAPGAPEVPAGPVIEENLGRKTPARTYQDLLSNPHDEALLEHHMRVQLVRIDLDGQQTPFLEPDLYLSASPSPDGRYVMLESTHKPWSYQVPLGRFPRRMSVVEISSGEEIYEIADLPLAVEIPIGFSATRTGRRAIGWRQDAPATIKWVEAQDGGDPERDVPIRDHLYTLAAPFTDEPTLLAKTATRLSGISWGRGDLALVTEAWWQTRRMRVWIIQPDHPDAEAQLLFDRSWEDRYDNPGSPMMRETPSGHVVLHTSSDGESLFFVGAGASPEGNKPFLDRRPLGEGEVERLWRSAPPHYEAPVALLDDDAQRLLTARESVEEAPNYFIRDLSDPEHAPNPLTHFPHPTPQLKGVQKELIRYQRADGLPLTGTLYLPAGYDAERDGPLPTLLWAYPQEFKSASAAGQVRNSPHRFVRVGWYSPLLWLMRGWAVLNDPAMPIVGEGDEEPNDTYIEQLVSGAKAAIDTLTERGVTDPDRVAIGGHSYGAFMTANLLAHSDLFRAGIARSGAYNRTLTPFGFQAEERTLWQAPDTYAAMSPFNHADKITAPLLLIHGAMDNNSGTYPMQSERFYQALKGHGATARLVMLPHESHGYQARESIMHMAWEMNRWLELHVAPRDAADAAAAEHDATQGQSDGDTAD